MKNKLKQFIRIYFLKPVRIFFKTKSLKRVKFYFYEIDMNVSKFDNDMLLAQLGYFGHHTEKAIKHHNRANRGRDKRNKLELLINEVIKRNMDEPETIEWAKNLIEYFDTNNKIYIDLLNEKQIINIRYDILDFIKLRTTTRFWQQKEVESEIIEDILYTSMHSALSCNRQTIRFYVMKNKIENMVVGDSNNKSMFDKAPVLIYVMDDERFFSEKYGNALNVGGVCSMIQLASSAYGLSSTWMYYADFYDQEEIRTKLKLKDYMFVYSVIALGYPLEKQQKPPRLNIKQFIIKRIENNE